MHHGGSARLTVAFKAATVLVVTAAGLCHGPLRPAGVAAVLCMAPPSKGAKPSCPGSEVHKGADLPKWAA